MNELTFSNTNLSNLLHSGDGITPLMTQDIFLTRQVVVGTRYVGGSDELVEELTPGSRVNLLHETDNRFDSRAVMVIDAKGRKLGYLPRHQNAIVCALLDAGRHFYGLITEKPERTSDEEDAPYQFYIDLYLRDYVNPEEMTSVPRQGDLSSYAVISVGLSASDGEDREKYIGRIAALKIINGEERGYFERELPEDNSPDDRREMLRLFHEFTGFLPFVSHGIESEKRRILEEAYGTLLGEAFSNHVIDTAKMAKLRIPEIRNTSLTSYAKELGIECEAVTEAEEECRLTWKFYQRLERSELERIPELNIRMTLLEELYENDEIGIRVYKSLKRAGIIMLGDLMDRSAEDLLKIRYIEEEDIYDLKAVLKEYEASLSEEDYDPSIIGFTFPTDFSEVSERALEVALQREEPEERQRIRELPEDERSDEVSRILDGLITRFEWLGDEKSVLSMLTLGSLIGYRGDYSRAAFADIEGEDEGNLTNAYYMLGRFYESWHDGKLRQEAGQSMMKVCVYLGRGILEEKIMDGADEETRKGAAGLLFREAARWGYCAPQNEESAELLLMLGEGFLRGEFPVEDGVIFMDRDPESAYRAAYYAGECGSPGAKELMEEIEKA